MKQSPKETELEKFSLSIHAALLLKPKENKQINTLERDQRAFVLTQFVFFLSLKMTSTWCIVAETEKLSQNKEVVELRTSEATSPDKHIAGNRSHSAGNGADGGQRAGSNCVKTGHKPRPRSRISI